MILGVALANITHNLDNLRQRDGHTISSHAELKQEGLACLKALIEEAPTSEYLKFFNTHDHGLLLAYTLNVLCYYSKDDKSRAIRERSLANMLSLMSRLEGIHNIVEMGQNCSVKPLVSALPGVSSTLFQLIMQDTKLPRTLLVISIKNLAKLISIAFLPCKHKPSPGKLPQDESQKLKDTCDNLAIRLNFLVDYSMNNSSELPNEMLLEVLDMFNSIMISEDLLISTIEPMVKYLAFMSADNRVTRTPEVELKLMIITDTVKCKIQNGEDQRLDSVIISGIFRILDNLESNVFSLLLNERQAALAVLLGFLKLLPRESLTTFLEFGDRRMQLINLLIKLSEFSANQPFLLLTDSKVSDTAIEVSGSKIYSVEKRFKHLRSEELLLIREICQIIGTGTEWSSLNDIIMNDLRRFSDPGNLFITYSIMQGFSQRNQNSVCVRSLVRFIAGMLTYYIDSTEQEFIGLTDEKILTIVIAIESMALLIEILLKFVSDKSLRIIVLKDLLCPLLKWASSGSRAISEAALSALAQISQLYGFDSTKSLIEDNIDYIVNGVMELLENFYNNCDITHVLAITFKLSSKNSFYFFKDVFDRLFRVLAIYQHTDKAQSILLLFHRTLTSLIEWDQIDSETITGSPLENQAILGKIISDLSISRRVRELATKKEKAERHQETSYETTNDARFDESQVIEDIKAGKLPDFMKEKLSEATDQKDTQDDDEAKKRPDEIVLTEKILIHCVSMISSDYPEVKILALKTAALGFEVLRDDENTLLPLVHKIWGPLEKRLVGDYRQNLEVSLCSFECLVSMARNAKDFIKRRTLDSIIPRICLFLESRAKETLGKKDYGPYSMTVEYKCQLKILSQLGALAYHISLAYSNLWRVVRTTLLYLNASQMESLRDAAKISLHYMIALDADCVWYFAKQANLQTDLPFHLVYELERSQVTIS